MSHVKRWIGLAASGVVALAALGAAADDHGRAHELLRSGEIVPLHAVVERARAEGGGELIEAELEREDGRYVYEVEMLDTQGRVWERRYDARTGEPLGEAREEPAGEGG